MYLPPVVNPPVPTLWTLPPITATSYSCANAYTSPQTFPGSMERIFLSSEISIFFISSKEIVIPPSMLDAPGNAA